MYSWISRSFCTFRSGSESKVLRADGRTKLLERVVIVSSDRRDLRVGHGDFRVEPGELQMLLVLLWAVMAASQRQNQRIVTLQFTELAWSVPMSERMLRLLRYIRGLVANDDV